MGPDLSPRGEHNGTRLIKPTARIVFVRKEVFPIVKHEHETLLANKVSNLDPSVATPAAGNTMKSRDPRSALEIAI